MVTSPVCNGRNKDRSEVRASVSLSDQRREECSEALFVIAPNRKLRRYPSTGE